MSRFWAAVAATGVAFVGATVASAADLRASPAQAPVAAPPSCDFFEAELISYLCARTAYVGVGGEGYGLTNTRTIAVPGGVATQTFRTRQGYEGGDISITPWQGFRISLGDQAFQYRNTLSPPGTTTSGSQGGWLSVGGEYTLWDQTNPYGRFLTNIVARVEHFEGGGPYQGRDLQMIGWNSGAKFALGGSGFSLNYFGNTLFQHFDGPNETRLSSYTRLLLANDAWGVGVGPRLNTINELWHAPGVNTGWSDTMLGGEALLAPFRATSIAFLRDMTLDGYYVHSVGQAGLVPRWNGSATAYDFGGSARFNFRF